MDDLSPQLMFPPWWAMVIALVLLLATITWLGRLGRHLAIWRVEQRRLAEEEVRVDRSLHMARQALWDDPQRYGHEGARRLRERHEQAEALWTDYLARRRALTAHAARWRALALWIVPSLHATARTLQDQLHLIESHLGALAHMRAMLNRFSESAPRMLEQVRAVRAALADALPAPTAASLAQESLHILEALEQALADAVDARDMGVFMEALAPSGDVDGAIERLVRAQDLARRMARDPQMRTDAAAALFSAFRDASVFNQRYREWTRRLGDDAEARGVPGQTVVAPDSAAAICRDLSALCDHLASGMADVRLAPVRSMLDAARQALASGGAASAPEAHVLALLDQAASELHRLRDQHASGLALQRRLNAALEELWRVVEDRRQDLGTNLLDRIAACTQTAARADDAAHQARPDWPELVPALTASLEAVQAALGEARQTIAAAARLRTTLRAGFARLRESLAEIEGFSAGSLSGDSSPVLEELVNELAALELAYERGASTEHPSTVAWLADLSESIERLQARMAAIRAEWCSRVPSSPAGALMEDVVQALDGSPPLADMPGPARRRRRVLREQRRSLGEAVHAGIGVPGSSHAECEPPAANPDQTRAPDAAMSFRRRSPDAADRRRREEDERRRWEDEERWRREEDERRRWEDEERWRREEDERRRREDEERWRGSDWR